ncbi:HNH nuclease [Syntrophobotulus glycolicus DSM 8271]|uniref:HNH nuclease n=1 Tax=Syntrophobotulus glycolicus (strain DSM 8271 / FlGlyR) TaxID=645991 RepID=F0T1P2_SYNGF|nr:HNH endonuclease [Syntrophobotulus glycolicus]ADY57466.1 HNH nuclease [Syntrophobotulus glycolicus DSM 8271]
MRRSIKTNNQEIVDYWFSRVDECGLSVDAAEAHERCWRCGYEAPLERCHIIPDSLGGEDTPSNLVLLCHRCHLENPNVTDPEIMWDWIRAYGTSFYDAFWMLQGIKEYQIIYGRSFEEELKEQKIDDEERFKRLFQEEIKKTTFHYGHPYLNSATIAGVMRIILKKYAG